jgi:hypothetical protein
LFLKTLAQSLRPNFFVNPPEDAEWCARFGLAELLDDSALIDQWKAPERIIELLSGKKGKRDQELARFNLKDMADLEQLLRPLGAPTPRAVRFKNELKKEAEAIRQSSRQELANPSAQEDLRRRFDYSYKLVDALNERHNSAVQNVLGISSDGLKELFLRLRRELRDRRLVLLLEDITAWEGVDRQLIDVLVTNVETRQEQDLCPMVSVVGVTPAYFQNKSFQANYFQRITHHVQLGNPSSTQVYQEVSALQTQESQIAFAARYLRATRVGVERLTEWNGGPDPVPNPCESCLHRETCHREFGSYQGIGLFPFTGKAITRLYSVLRDPQHTATYQTPRGMLQGVLSPTLQHPQALDAGDYPGPEIETDLIGEDDRRLFEHGQMAEILEASVESGRIRERMRRLIAYWGRKGSAATHTVADDDGSLVYGGVRQGIYQALGLPWLGSETPDGSRTGEERKPAPEPARTEKPTSPGTATGTTSGARTGTQGQEGTGRPGTPDGRRSMTATQLLRVKQDIARWSEGKKPERPTELNRLAYEILDKLNWGHLDISPWLRSRLFTEDTVILRDTKPARLQHLVLEREAWVKKGIEAYQVLRTGGEGLQPSEVEAHRRAYAMTQRKLATATKAKVRDRLPALENGEPWDILGTATQVLLARAWLRGNVSPLAASWEQWRAVICDEGPPLSNPQDRVEVWNTLVDSSGGIHPTLRTLLRVSLTLPQYQPDPNQQHLDTSLALVSGELVKALQSLRQTFSALPQPASTQGLGEKLSELKRLTEVAAAVSQRLKLIPRYEADRLVERARTVEGRCRSATIRYHMQRVDGVVEAVAGHFPNQVSGQAQEWRTARQRLKAQGFLDSGAEYAGAVVEDFIDRVAKGDISPSDDRAQALAWALAAPASALRTVYEGLDTAEKTISGLLQYVEEYLKGSSEAGGTLDDVHRMGERVQVAAECAIMGLKDGRNG